MRRVLTALILSYLLASSGQVVASDSISYSGRLVNANGSPVTGPVNLKIEFAYSGTPAAIICTQDLTSVGLTNGVFHIKLGPNCTVPSSTTLASIFSATPATESVGIRVTDVTHSKIYSYQALHSMPFSLISHMAKQIEQLGATNGQVLAWNNTTKKWEPTNAGAGNGSVTEITTGSGLVGGPITNTGTISIDTGGVTDTHLATGAVTSTKILDGTIVDADVSNIAAIARAKLAVGTPNYVLINDASGVMSGVAQLPITHGGTGASTASGARTNLGLGTSATRDVYGSGDVITADSLPSIACLPTEKLLWLIPGGWSCATDADSMDATKLPLAGGTMTGDLSMGNMKITNLVMSATPNPADAANVDYVDDAIVAAMAGFSGSQWITSAPNIYYTTGRVGVGTNAPVDGLVDIKSERTDSTGPNNTALSIEQFQKITTNGAYQTRAFIAKPYVSVDSGVTSTSPLIGGSIYAYRNFGTKGSGDNGTMSSATGLQLSYGHYNSYSAAPHTSGDVFGLWLQPSIRTGTISGNLYDIYLNPKLAGGSVSGKHYSFYAADTAATSYFAGLVGIGEANPTSKLHVAGDTKIDGKLSIKSTTSNYIELRAPSSLAATLPFVFPSNLGTSGQMLTTDGAGNLSWTTVSTGSSTLGGDLTGTTASAVIANDAVTSAKILDGTIVNADVSATAAIARSKLANGTANYVVVNNGSGVMSEVAQLPIAQGGTGASTAAAARTNLGLGTAATRDVSGTGDVITASSLPSIACTASEKLLWQIPGGWTCTADLDSADGTKLPLAGGTMSGPINMGGTNKITNLGTPTANADAATKLYVDNLVSGFTGSQWTTSGSNIYYNGGNVGIGTNAPATKLHVQDASSAVLTMKSTSATGTAQFRFYRNTKETSFGPSGSSFDLYSVEGLPLEVRLDGSTLAMHLSTAGVMTIGPTLSLRANDGKYLELKTAATLSGNLEFVLPSGYGTNGQVLTSNGSGLLSWTTPLTTSTSLGGDVTGTIASNTIANSAVTSAKIADGTIVNADIANGTITYAKLNIADGEIPAVKVNGLSTALSGKEPTITAGTTAQYWRGDKTWQTLNTTAVPEGTNLYFTEPRVLGTDLLGLNVTALLGPVIATDDVLSAIGKLQGQVTANKTSFDDSGVWSLSGGNVYRSTGYVSIGTATPLAVLTVAGGTVNSWATGTIRLASDATANYIQSGVDTSSGSARDLRFSAYNSSNALMTIKSDGKVGIGTSTPQNLLDVSTASAGAGILSRATASLGLTSGGGLLAITPNIPTAVDQRLGFLGFGAYSTGTTTLYGAGISGWSKKAWTPSDTSSYLVFETANGYTDRNERMRIEANGNVGIGTASPAHKFVVQDTDGAFDTLFSTGINNTVGVGAVIQTAYNASGTGEGRLNFVKSRGSIASPTAVQTNDKLGTIQMRGWDGDSYVAGASIQTYVDGPVADESVPARWEIRTADAVRMTIKDDGKIGVGTTAPSRQFVVANDAGNSSGTFGGGVPLVRLQGTGSNFSEPSIEFAEQTNAPMAAIAAKNISGGAGHLILQTRKTGDASLTEKMRINDDGNIGIGLTSPTSLLHVQKNADSSSTVMVQNLNSGAEAYAQVNLKTNSGLNSGMWKNSPNKNFYAGVNSLNVGTNGAENVSLVTNNISRLIVDSSGRVGVGGFPSHMFDVAGDVNGARILVAGNQVCTSGGCTTSSDKRLKKNIYPLQESFEKILSLQGVEYDWKDTKKYGSQHQVGFIAQDLEKVYPEVVVTDPKTGLKSVAYGNLVAPLIEAFKELVNQTKENSASTKKQTREIASLKEENEALKKENAEMKARLDRIEKALKLK